ICHQKEVDFWKKTHHAQAWATLEHVNKQFDRSCISCHVTGWMKPGGSTLGTLAKDDTLRDVQSERCHGPGSLHAEDGKRRETMRRDIPQTICADCHTPEHSDTFDYTA